MSHRDIGRHRRLGHARRGGFTLVEALIGACAVGALLTLLGLYGADVRRNVGLGQSLANLRQYGVGTFSYANEFDDLYPTFSWVPGSVVDTPYADVREAVMTATNVSQAHAAQATHLIRLRGGMPDFPIPSSWISDISFSHLVLLAHLQERFRETFTVSPGDAHTRGWHDGSVQVPEPDLAISERFRFWSSYETPPTWYSPEELTSGSASQWSRRIGQAGSHAFYAVPLNCPFQGRSLASVAFPSQKIMVFEKVARYFGSRVAFFAFPEARIPLLLADGSAHVRVTVDSNRGWNPYVPNNRSVTRFVYEPSDWEPSALGADMPVLNGHYRWTRWGAGEHGRDFGPEHPPF